MTERILMKGNEALAEGAVRAGCRFFAGYPITPQNEIPEYMSWRLPEVGGTFIQAESEVAAINMIFGASACGARVMTSSSGPGISLKQEGISYIAGAEIPIFYADIMRGGPGLGNIAPAQGDYFQATRGGGHGDYRVIVFAPNSVIEMGNFPRICYELADKYRMPSMILADGLLGQMMEPIVYDFEPIDPKDFPEKDYLLGCTEGRERRVVRSYDLRPGYLEKNTLKLEKKFKSIEENEVRYDDTNMEGADLVMVAFGTASRVCKSAIPLAKEAGMKVGLLRPITLWPFPMKVLRQIADEVEHILVVEMNIGQMVEDVKLAVEGKSQVHFYGRPSGSVPVTEEIFEQVKMILKK
ncbi:MAG: 2-ketoisovalerate ferredoxin oxidoreductase [candidate division Zixibacteria bacterium SM23_73_2]|nr:MAG: 2-ketoisovalerate ferredoxin oxidoreductase [candidate division Zixibacteria bacterium SM23_73_2]